MRATFAIDARTLTELGLERARDRVIFERARLARAAILTKDFDFVELAHRLGRAALACDVEHRSDEEAHHVMEKAVGLDHERESPRPVDPPRVTHRAPMIVRLRRRALNREAAEAMLADDCVCGRVEKPSVERLPLDELARAPEG